MDLEEILEYIEKLDYLLECDKETLKDNLHDMILNDIVGWIRSKMIVIDLLDFYLLNMYHIQYNIHLFFY